MVSILNARLAPDPTIAARLRDQKVLAFAGIGRPAKFFATLQALGARVARRAMASPTISAIRRRSSMRCRELEAARLGLTPVSTEKDFVRLGPAYAQKIVALPVALVFEDAAAVGALLAEALARRRARH